MMKILKLTGIALGVLLIIVGAFWLSMGSGPSKSADDFEDPAAREMAEQITEEWHAATEWQRATYDNRLNIIRQRAASGLFSDLDAELLTNHLNNAATNSLKSLMLAELNKADCRDAVVRDYKRQTDFMTEVMGNDERLALLSQCYNLYVDISRFTAGNFSLSPRFNGTSWTDFSAYRRQQAQRVENYRSNATYKQYLANITALKEGLNAVSGKLTAASGRFYERLYAEIVAHYDSLPHTAADRSALHDVYSRFRVAQGNGSLSDRLYTYYLNYEIDEAA